LTAPDHSAPAIGEVTEEIYDAAWSAYRGHDLHAALQAAYPLIAQRERARTVVPMGLVTRIKNASEILNTNGFPASARSVSEAAQILAALE